jgi:hypothetical protein
MTVGGVMIALGILSVIVNLISFTREKLYLPFSVALAFMTALFFNGGAVSLVAGFIWFLVDRYSK